MAVIPYLSQGMGVDIDPYTGLPKKKQSFTQQQVNASLAANPQGTFGPSPLVDYGSIGSSGAIGGPIRTPGFLPDYASLINTDPVFSQLRSDLAALGVSDAASRAASTQRAIAQFGLVPDLNGLQGLNASMLNEDITPEARALAQRNSEAGLSITARQERQFQNALRQMRNALAARGALRSGEAGFQAQELQRDYDAARFDTTQQLVDFIAGLQAGFADRERQRQMQQSQGAESAMSRQMQLNPATGETITYPQAPAAPAPEPQDQLAETLRRLSRSGGGGGGQPFMVI